MTIEQIKTLHDIFYSSPRTQSQYQNLKMAAVALLLRQTQQKHLEIAFIRRAHSNLDPWSGQIAFPGGRQDHDDQDDIATVLREVREELGLEILRPYFLGYLSDIQARNRSGHLPLFVRPIAFEVPTDSLHFEDSRPSHFNLNQDEVEDLFWIDVNELMNPKRMAEIQVSGIPNPLPAIRIPSGDLLWGLTLKMVQEFLSRLNP